MTNTTAPAHPIAAHMALAVGVNVTDAAGVARGTIIEYPAVDVDGVAHNDLATVAWVDGDTPLGADIEDVTDLYRYN